jgi:hypothetical protein
MSTTNEIVQNNTRRTKKQKEMTDIEKLEAILSFAEGPKGK